MNGCRAYRQFERRHNGKSPDQEDATLSAPICFVCARIKIFDPEYSIGNCSSKGRLCGNGKGCGEACRKGAIRWTKPFNGNDMYGLNADEIEKALGTETYIAKYMEAQDSEIFRQELSDWTINIPFDDKTVAVLCSPEDIRCSNEAGHQDPNVLCQECRLPICVDCETHLCSSKKQTPQLALANDMFIGWIPEIIYKRKMTYVDILCASVMSVNVMSMQLDYYGDHRREQVGNHTSRTGARGNFIAFGLPLEELAKTFNSVKAGEIVLPRWGKDLAGLVQVYITYKSQGEEDQEGRRQELRRVVTEAYVKRANVLDLIQELKNRKHPHYVDIDMDEVVQRAQAIPEYDIVKVDGNELVVYNESVPPPRDDGKAAVPPDRNTDLQGAFDLASRSAITADARGSTLGDANANHLNAMIRVYKDISAKSHQGANPVDPDGERASEDPDETALGDAATQFVTNESQGEQTLADTHIDPRTVDTNIEAPAATMETLILTTGEPANIFDPKFFSAAFPMLFPFGSGCPDIVDRAGKGQRDQRTGARVGFADAWTSTLMQRAESQFRSDMVLPFALWNRVFFDALRSENSMYGAWVSGMEQFSAADIKDAVESITSNLLGSYPTESGHMMPVNGDLMKVTRCLGLTPLAKHMVRGMHATLKKVPGSQQVRTLMQGNIQPFRIFYGSALMITWSPSERFSGLMLRMHREREADPVKHLHKTKDGEDHDPDTCIECECAKLEGPCFHNCEHVDIHISSEEIAQMIPESDVRRRILLRNPLACVLGFRTHVAITLQALFGVRMCPNCPHCNGDDVTKLNNKGENITGCCDMFGSISSPVGGIFGRVDAYYGSIECQKAGSLHIHCLIWVQAMHQHLPLQEIAIMIEDSMEKAKEQFDADPDNVVESQSNPGHSVDNLVDDFLKFKRHVKEEKYADVQRFIDKQEDIEEEWPEYKTSTSLLLQRGTRESCPEARVEALLRTYENPDDVENELLLADGEKWKIAVAPFIQRTQELVQHHIHPFHGEERAPLPGCKSTLRKSKLCKGGFPKQYAEALFNTEAVVCPGVGKIFDINTSGRKSGLGNVIGPCNHEYLNGTHRGLLLATQCNSDVMLTYRLPLSRYTHSKLCKHPERCMETLEEMIKTSQRCQNDVEGYISQYISKRTPVATDTLEKFNKAQASLSQLCRRQGHDIYSQVRSATSRLISDMYGAGTQRFAVETVNLLTQRDPKDVTGAESFMSMTVSSLPCKQYMALERKCVADEDFSESFVKECQEMEGYVWQADRRNAFSPTIGAPYSQALIYGYRNRHPDLIYLTPYEFVMKFSIIRVRYPTSHQGHYDTMDLAHATLTQEGRDWLKEDKSNHLEPTKHYVIRGVQGFTQKQHWFALDSSAPSIIRDDYVIVRRTRMTLPRFDGNYAVQHKASEEHIAKSMCVYFRPWVVYNLHDEELSEHVSELYTLKDEETTWKESWRSYLNGGVLNKKMCDVIRNFQIVHSERQTEELDDENIKLLDKYMIKKLETHQYESAIETDTSRAVNGGDDRDDILAGFQFITDTWGRTKERFQHDVGEVDFTPPCDPDKALSSAAESQKSQISVNDGAEGERDLHDEANANIEAYLRHVEDWKLKMKNTATASQYGVVEKVAARLSTEVQEIPNKVKSDSMRLFVTGGPGVGKSFVTRCLEDIFTTLGMKKGIHYQFAAFQAIVAHLVEGDTLHHLFGINMYGAIASKDAKTKIRMSRAMSKMRWLVIDEISQVEALLLYNCEKQTRQLVQHAGTYKRDRNGDERLFGGINVIFVGDFYQLPPPGKNALSLDTIPDFLLHSMNTSVPLSKTGAAKSGVETFWNLTDFVELKEQVRCDDPWWCSVLDEFRYATLTEMTHAFLHGKQTRRTGTWLGNKTLCKNKTCEKLCAAAEKHEEDGDKKAMDSDLKQIKEHECKKCRKERSRRTRVVDGPTDSRLREARFETAVTIVANNDMKCDICKTKAREYARRTQQRIQWVVANDAAKDPSAIAKLEELHAAGGEDAVRDEKIRWLTKHDRKCGKLYGMLPLVKGMPVFLSMHIDRSSKGLLQGRDGTLVGWDLDEREPPHPDTGDVYLRYHPKAVYVKFKDVTWKLDGIDEVGVYPIKDTTATWHVKATKPKSIQVRRQQIPISPGFARTAYSVQGFTLLAAIVDLCFQATMDIITAYIALSRVKRADDILIMRPFSLERYQEGVPINKKVMMAYFKREDPSVITDLLQEYLEMRSKKQCAGAGCRNLIEKGHTHCENCSVTAVVERLKKCRICRLRHAKPEFTLPMWNILQDGHRSRICIDCENNAPRCIRCNSLKQQSDFTALEWQKGKERYTCFACQESKRKRQERKRQEPKRQERALKKCSICKEYFPEKSFMPTQWSKQRNRTCKTCTEPSKRDRIDIPSGLSQSPTDKSPKRKSHRT